MTSKLPENFRNEETPDIDFWRYCRREADRRNVPAWMLAEEAFFHRDLTGGLKAPNVRR